MGTLSRRGWMAAAVGAIAAAGGVALALRRSGRQAEVLSAAEVAFWAQSFARVDGSAMATTLFRGRPLVLNFWATWCPPCIEELPLLDAFFKENVGKSWQVLGLAVDQAGPVQRFLQQTPLAFPVALAGFPGVELSRSLGNLNGGLPFSVVFDAAGHVIYRKLGRLSALDVAGFKRLPV